MRAALALRDRIGQSGDGRLRAGVACGRVLASGEADVTGPAVQLAAALADRAAGGETLLCEATRARLSDCVQVETYDGPLPAYRLRSLRKPGSAPPRHALVGRAVELAQLRQALRTCVEARLGQTVVLRGEAGIGKTRLLDEAIAEARRIGMDAHKVLVLDESVESGWEAVRALVFALLELDDAAGEAARRAAAERVVAQGLLHREQRVFIEDLLRLSPPADTAERRALDAPSRLSGMRRALHDLLVALARRVPLLLAIEDVHWAQADTLRWFAPAGLAADAPVLLLLTTRAAGEADSIGLRQVIGAGPLLTLDLGPLRERDIRALAASLGGAEQTVDAAVERAEGNPWFVEQLLRAPPGAQIPGSIQSVVLARTDRLHALDRQALQAASVLGQRSSLAALRSVLGEADYDPQALIEHALLRWDDQVLAFTHALLRDGVYDSLPGSRRQVLHARAARYFGSAEPVPHAEHLAQAAQPEAPAALLEAARSLVRGFQLEGALRLTERGLRLAAQQPLRSELLRMKGDLLRDLGRVEPSIAALKEALALAQSAIDRAKVWLAIAAGMRVLDRHDEALQAIDRAQEAAGEAAPLELLASIEALRGNIHFPLGHIEQCLAAHDRARALALEAGLPEAEARALGGLGDAYYQQGRMLTAFRHFDDCVRLAEQHRAVFVTASNLSMRGITLLYQNRLVEGWADGVRAAETAVRIGDGRSEVVARNAAAILIEQGELAGAEREFQRALELSRMLGAQRFEAVCAAHLGSIAASSGRRDRGLAQLRAALAQSRSIGDSFATPWICGLLAVAAEGEEREQALGLGERVLGDGGCVSHNHLWFYRYAIDAALAAADDAAVRCYASALAAYTAAEPLPWADFYVRRGRLLAAMIAKAATDDSERELCELIAEARRCGLAAALPALEAHAAAGRSS